MSTKNKMTIIGYLGADPELRYTTSGRPVANLRVATTERWTDKAGTAQEHTEWHRVVAWGTSPRYRRST
jgi:single-strand DNA-binding protein